MTKNGYRLGLQLASVFLFGASALGTSGCSASASATVTAGSCSADATLSCGAGSAGYSCPTGSLPPSSDGTCSDPVTDGTTDSYCCLTSATFTGCTVDTTLTCTTSGSYGFDCTSGSADPSTADSSLTCSAPTTLSNGDDGYCCTDSASTGGGGGSCASDSTLVCGTGSSGFSCPTGSLPPASDGTCSDPVVNGNMDSYCCLTATFTGCTVDTTLTCTTSGSYGFDCTSGSADPSTTDSSLTCSAPSTLSNGDDGYCCTEGSGSTTSGCTADATLTCPDMSASGYTCTDSTTMPMSATGGSLDCSEPVASGTMTSYCCFAPAGTSSCAPDDTVTCPTAGSFGFTCTTATDDPTMLDPTLTCSTATATASGGSQYCCE